MSTIQANTAKRHALIELFATDLSDDACTAAVVELARLNQAILSAPAASAADVAMKLSVWGSVLEDYGSEIIDGQATLWACLMEDVSAFGPSPVARAA
jgi:hypothetical protein